MLQELPSAVQYNIYVSHQIAVCIQQLRIGNSLEEIINLLLIGIIGLAINTLLDFPAINILFILLKFFLLRSFNKPLRVLPFTYLY
jgi:hypothetical protein